MADDIVVDVSFKGNSTQFLAELSRAVGSAKSQLEALGQSTQKLSRLETQLARMSGEAKQFAQSADKAGQATAGWSQKWTPFKGQFQEAESASKGLWKSIDTGIAQADSAYARASKSLMTFEQQQQAAARTAAKQAPMQDWDKQFNDLSRAADVNTQKIRQAQKAVDDYQASLSNTRYVLYDVAGTLTTIGTALLIPFAGAAATAIQMEKAFAQVERTSGVTGVALQQLKTDFDDLFGSIPITYDALAQIATLAGQLGVPADRIANFTEVTAKLAAVTDLSVEQAATAFGRLDALIPNVNGQYERLGSAIAKVGVNSVATESQIVNISTQISSMGAFAGLTAQDIIGLSGALASVGAQPELSRGTVTRVFTLMSKAVAEGGDKLESFAKTSGVSAEQFAQTWGKPEFGQTFLGFMNGIRNEGGNAVAVLNELGVTSVRDVPLLLRLANAADSTGKAGALLAQTMGDANQGWSDNIELQRQYAIIASTVAAKLEVLWNNVQLLAQAVGGPMLESFGQFIDFLTDATKWATEFAQSDLGGSIVRVTVVLTALAGVVAIAAGGLALMGASSIGVYQALQFIVATSPKAATAILGTSTAAAIADGTLKAGAASAALFTKALGALTLVGLAFVLPDILVSGGQAIADNVDKMTGLTRDWENALRRLTNPSGIGDMSQFDVLTNGLTNFLFTVPWDQGSRDIAFLTDELVRLADSGDFTGLASGLEEISRATGKSLEYLLNNGNLGKRLEDAGVKVRQLADGSVLASGAMGQFGAETDVATMAQDALAQAAEVTAASMGLESEVLDALKESLKTGSAAFFDFAGMVKAAYGEAGGGIQQFIEMLDEQLKAQGAWADNVTVLTARGATNLVTELAKMGPEGAALAADAVNMTTEQLNALEGKMAEAARLGTDGYINGLITSQPLLAAAFQKNGMDGLRAMQEAINTNSPAAVQAVINTLNSQFGGNPIKIPSALQDPNNIYGVLRNAQQIAANNPIRLSTTIQGQYGFGTKQAYATGGKVEGPGTGTSDSILARLSNNEFVLKANAAKAIGYGRLDYMNRYGKLPGFANGGQVGGGSSSVSFPNSMMTEMSPTDRALLAQRQAPIEMTVNIARLAREVNAFNARQTKRGA